MVLDGAPVAAIDRVRPKKIDGAGDPAPGALGHHQQNAVAHLFADDREEFAGEIRPAPFARAGVHVEGEKRVPYRFGQIGAGEPGDLDAGRERFLALAADGLALARGERGQEIVETGVAAILPVELLVVALQEAALAEQAPFRLGQEGDVRRRQLVCRGDLDQGIGKGAAHGLRQRAGADEQARAGHRRERHRHLQFGVIVAAGVLEGLGPAMVEDVFAARMALHVAGRGAQKGAVGALGQQVARLPAGAAADRKRSFKR